MNRVHRGPTRAVRFERYGAPEVLQVVEVPKPSPSPGEVLVANRAAGINPGEARIRSGALHAAFPARFPSGQGSDLAGIVEQVGSEVRDFRIGNAVLGYSWARSSHATHATIPATQLIAKPAALDRPTAGSLCVVACTAYAAVRAIDPRPGETVAVSAAAGGVGALVVQLLIRQGVRVLGIASEAHHQWLRDHGVIPIAYGPGLRERIRSSAPGGVDAFIDMFGLEYLRLPIDLGLSPERIETIISFELSEQIGARHEGGEDASTRPVLTAMASLSVDGSLELPVECTFPLSEVADAFRRLELRHTLGKLVLVP